MYSEIPTPAANSTVYVYPSPVESTSKSCTEEKAPTPTPEYPSEVYTPPAPQTPSEVYTPPAPESTKTPQPSKEVYTPPAPESSKIPQPSKEVYTPPPVYSSAPVYTPAPKPSTKEAEKPKPSKPADTPSYGGNGRIVTKGNKWAMTYTPYASNGDCKSAEEVKGDIAKIAEMGFTTIRSYSTDCGVFENVVPACQSHGLKVIYGIFLEAGGSGGKGPFSSYANDQLQEIISNAPKDSVAMIIVGNEFLFNNYGTAEELGSYIDHVKEELKKANFPSEIAVTTTEPVDVWENKGQALCSHIDVFACQVHPFFTAKVYASEAGDFASEQLEKAAAVCPEAASKGKYITEIGWPKKGETNGNAVPGYSEQKEAISNILDKVGKEACVFSFGDDIWKAPGAFGVEQSFGASGAIY